MNKLQRALAAGLCSAAFVGSAMGGITCDRQGPLDEAADDTKDAVDDATR